MRNPSLSYKRTLPVIACLIASAFTVSLHAAPFSNLVVFGDSLSDTGNAYHQLGSLAMNPDDYYDGRFSNGPVWVEYLADQLQLAPPVANTINTSNGRNYAFGGAWTDGSGFIQLFINDIDEQVSDYLNNDGGPTGDELIVLLGGANDFFDGQTNPATPANNLTADINNLYNAGARNFLVVNLPLLGQTPDYLGSADQNTLDNLSIQFNNLLADSIDNLGNTLPGAAFFQVDAQALITDAINNPTAFGFTNVTSPALGHAGINPDQYLFWDGKHPTTRAHKLLAQYAAADVFNTLYTLPGDLDLDGYVGLNDLQIVLDHWNTNVTPGNPLLGDPTADGYVGLDDLQPILDHWNTGTLQPDVANTIIPEPTTITILLLSLLIPHTRRV